MSATTRVPESPADRSGSADRQAAPWTGPGRIAVASVVAVGVVFRIASMSGALGRPDSDEVLTSLLARHIWSDGWPAYLWGQHYGGTIEALPVAVSYAVFGPSTLALRVPALLLGVATALLVWRCARRLVSPGAAKVAGLLVWVWPPAAVWFGTREQLFYGPTVVIGLVAVLLTLRRVDPGERIARLAPRAAAQWLGAGLALGLGWWTSPNIMYFAVPVVVVVLLAPERTARLWWPGWSAFGLASLGAVIGAMPWLATNVLSGFPSLHDSQGFTANGSYGQRIWWYLVHGLPAELGFRTIGTLQWIGGVLGVVAYLAALVGLAVAVRLGVTPRPRLVVGVDVVGFVVFPFLFATIPFGMDQANLRYLFFLAPFLALLVARLAVGRRSAAAVLIGAMVISGYGLVRLDQVATSPSSTFRIGRSGDLTRAIGALENADIDAVHADYWVAYRLSFESDERVIASPSAGALRSQDYETFVRTSHRAAWVVDAGSDQERALLARLDELGVAARVIDAGDYTVVIPDRNVQPEELPNEARAPAGAERPPAPGETY